MLVLARRPNETIVFPNIGITVRLVRVRGQVARLGIEAPDDVKILRGEIAPELGNSGQISEQPSDEWVHAMRNRLQSVLLTADLLQGVIEEGRAVNVQGQLSDLLTELQSLDEILDCRQEKTAPPATSFRVLVVEDQDNERTLLADVLEMKGCRVDTVADGAEALEYLHTHDKPDFVLLDMSMPRCSGPEFLEKLRKEQSLSDLKVFAVSGHTEKSSGVPVGPDGVDGWFRKPVNTNRLIESMHAARTVAGV